MKKLLTPEEIATAKSDPNIRIAIEHSIVSACDYGNILPPFGADMDRMVDRILEEGPTSREFGDMLQENHNRMVKEVGFALAHEKPEDKRNRLHDQQIALKAYNEEQKELKKAALKELAKNSVGNSPIDGGGK